MKTIAFLFTFVIIGITAFAGYIDDDGQLGLKWQAPVSGNPISGYNIHYDINGTYDSIQVTVDANVLKDSSVVLSSLGEWAVGNVRAFSIIGDTIIYSDWVSSDTAYFALPTGTNPPTLVGWE